MKSASVRFITLGAVIGIWITASGCICVSSSKKCGNEEVELAKAQAQCLTAQVELERINLEREKAGLPRVNAITAGATPAATASAAPKQ